MITRCGSRKRRKPLVVRIYMYVRIDTHTRAHLTLQHELLECGTVDPRGAAWMSCATRVRDPFESTIGQYANVMRSVA